MKHLLRLLLVGTLVLIGCSDERTKLTEFATGPESDFVEFEEGVFNDSRLGKHPAECVTLEFNISGLPRSYIEEGITVRSLNRFLDHLHLVGTQLLNHAPGSTPYEFTHVGGGSFTVVSVDVIRIDGGVGDFVSSDGAVIPIQTIGTITFPTGGWSDITSFRWNMIRGLIWIDNLVICQAASTPTPPANEPPTADAGEDQTVECEGNSSAEVTLDGSGSSDPDDDELSYDWTEGGSPIATGVSPTLSLGLGTHTITLTVDDGNGETATDEVVIIVEDTEAPTVNMTVSLTQLWPPNHTMHLVASGISASDTCCDVTLVVEVSSNEPVNGTGDGDTSPDWEVVNNGDGTFDVFVRAERAGKGSGRIYTITATATDCVGNVTVSDGTVDVPHSKGKRRK